MDDTWINSHLILQEDFRRKNIAAILQEYLPQHIIDQMTGTFVMVCRPSNSGACAIRSDTIGDRHVIVLSKYLIPTGWPPSNFPKEYIALILLHELAHIYLNHRPPSSDEMEAEADKLAVEWFNEAQSTAITTDDLQKVHMNSDRFWMVYGDGPRVFQ